MNPETLRCRILDYTKREMYLHGADGLTMDDIAKGMKMSKRTLYKLFPSKTCLFRICLSDFANEVRSHVQRFPESIPTALRRICRRLFTRVACRALRIWCSVC